MIIFFQVESIVDTCTASSFICSIYILPLGFSGGSEGKESARNAGDPGSIPGLGRSPGEGNGYPLQFSCQGNPMDTGAWWATVHGVMKRDTTE